MSNHFHLLLEAPPFPVWGLADIELLGRVSAFYSETLVTGLANALGEARELVYQSQVEETNRQGGSTISSSLR